MASNGLGFVAVGSLVPSRLLCRLRSHRQTLSNGHTAVPALRVDGSHAVPSSAVVSPGGGLNSRPLPLRLIQLPGRCGRGQ